MQVIGRIALLVTALFAASCGGPSVPPASASNGLPLEGIGPGALGVVKFDLSRVSNARLAAWLGIEDRASLRDGKTLARKALLAREGLAALGLGSIVAVIPSIDYIPEEIGIYLSGPVGIDREAIEDVFLKAGGLGIGGFTAANAFAKELGGGWYFYGWGTDGVLDQQDAGRTAALCDALQGAPPAIATLLLLADGREWITPDMIPEGEARTARRVRALADAGKNMRSIMVLGGGEAEIEWRITFERQSDARDAETAVRKTMNDVALMAEGSIAVGELDEYDLLGWKRMADGANMTVLDRALVIRPAAK